MIDCLQFLFSYNYFQSKIIKFIISIKLNEIIFMLKAYLISFSMLRLFSMPKFSFYLFPSLLARNLIVRKCLELHLSRLKFQDCMPPL